MCSGDSEGRLLLSPYTLAQQFLDSANRQASLLLGPGARSISCTQDSALLIYIDGAGGASVVRESDIGTTAINPLPCRTLD